MKKGSRISLLLSARVLDLSRIPCVSLAAEFKRVKLKGVIFVGFLEWN